MRFVIIYLSFIFLAFSTFAEEEAITLTGKRVLLKDNGQWEYIKVKVTTG